MTEASPSSEGSLPGAASDAREKGPASGGTASPRSGRQRGGISACVFWLDGQRFALDTAQVVEAIVVSQLVAVPLAPPWLLGLTSLRGTPLPVVELPLVLGLPPVRNFPESGPTGHPALVLRVDEVLVAGRVDRLEAVYGFEGARFEPAAANEHAAVKGLLEAGSAALPATLLDDQELARRLFELRRLAGYRN